MTEKKAEPAYVITESELRQIGDAVHEYGIIGAVPLFLKIRSRPHNPAPAIISVEPHPPGKEQLACDNTCPARCPGCEDTCPLWEHDEQVKREAREEVLNEMRDLVRNAKKYGTIKPEELFHWTGIIAMIDSLRGQHESKSEPECGACQGPAPFVAMSSAELITLAETEWTNRAERKQPAYDKRSWISGWFDGYFCKPKSDMSNGSTGAGNVSKMAGKIDKSLNPIPPNKYE